MFLTLRPQVPFPWTKKIPFIFPRRGGRDDSRDRRRRWRVASPVGDGWVVTVGAPLSPGRVTPRAIAAGVVFPPFWWNKFWRWSTMFKWFFPCLFFFPSVCAMKLVKSQLILSSSGSLAVCYFKKWLLCETSGHDNQEPLSIWKGDFWLLRC